MVPLAFVLPGKGGAAEGVFGGAHADLIAIVNTGRARHGHLAEHAQAQGTLLIPHDPEGPGGVMAVEQIPTERGSPANRTAYKARRSGERNALPSTALMGSALSVALDQCPGPQKPNTARLNGLIHHRIELIPLQPSLGGMPDFPHK